MIEIVLIHENTAYCIHNDGWLYAVDANTHECTPLGPAYPQQQKQEEIVEEDKEDHSIDTSVSTSLNLPSPMVASTMSLPTIISIVCAVIAIGWLFINIPKTEQFLVAGQHQKIQGKAVVPTVAVVYRSTYRATYEPIARSAAIQYGINPDIFVRQINQESGFQPYVVSSAGAIGIAQIMPGTAIGWGVNPHDPEASLYAAASAMSSYTRGYGSYAKALACYNAGCGAVNYAVSRGGGNWQAYLPLETQNYIRSILG